MVRVVKFVLIHTIAPLASKHKVMFSNIGTLLDRLQSLLSKGFLMGGLMPFLFLFALNWGIFYYVFPETYSVWSSLTMPPKENELLYWIKVVLILFIGGITLWNINPFLRQLWEGNYLPEYIREKLRQGHTDRFTALKEKKEELALMLYDYRNLYKNNLINDLLEARKTGKQKEYEEGSDIEVSEDLKTKFKDFKKNHDNQEPVDFETTKLIFDKLKVELKSKPADSKDLGKIHANFIEIYEEALTFLENRYERMQTDLNKRYPVDKGRIGPTALANIAEVHRDYGLQRYGLDIEYFWIRLLKLIRGDAEFYPLLEEAKSQLDFTVAITSVLGFSTLVWIGLGFFASSFWPIVVVGIFGTMATVIAYRISTQCYRGFTEVVRSAIDLNRFKLLEHLHISPPKNAEDEVLLWKQLSKGGFNIIYAHGEKIPPVEAQSQSQPTILTKLKGLFAVK